MPPKISPEVRFFLNVAFDPSGCWLWTGYVQPNGYAQFRLDGRRGHARAAYVHRIAYEWFRHEIPDGFEVDHLCRTRHCCNPYHLEVVPHAENIRRAVAAGTFGKRHRGQTHCKHGHEFTATNTYVTKDGKRKCKACRRAIQKRHYERARTRQRSA